METIIINYKELTDALAKLEEDYPSRMHGHIDLLRANIRDHMTQFLLHDTLIVELDSRCGQTYIGGKPITGHVYGIYDHRKNPTTSEIMYEQIIKAKKEAEKLGICERVFGKVAETDKMEDESILNKNPQEVQDYLNELAIAVCIKGERLEKYEKMAIKRCGNEAYANMKLFVEEVQRSVEREKFTNTSKVNLSYLGKNAGLSESVIIKITKYFEDKFAEKDREEDTLWYQCYPGYKPGYQNYLNRYPNGKYASTARSIIADLERKEKDEAKERAEREEKNFWNKCQTSDKSGFLKYLGKYPNGKYASTARSIIADLERKEKEEAKERAEREERNFWNKCQTNDKSGFLKYLDKYPNGKYASTARSIIANLEKGEKEKEEREKLEQKAEQQMWDRCRTKDDYQRYLDRYPYGIYASKAYVEMLKAEKEEKRQKEEAARMRAQQDENEFWLRCTTLHDYQMYLNKYPSGTYRGSAKSRIAELEQQSVKRKDKKEKKETKKGKLGCAIGIVLEIIVVFIVFYSYDGDFGGSLFGFLGLSGLACGIWAFIVSVFDLGNFD